MRAHIRNLLCSVSIVLSLAGSATAQPYNFPFSSGPIPMCDTSTFTANVFGIGTLNPPGAPSWFFTLQSLAINITTNHPQTLQITLTSPQGTTLLLSQYNGAGGQNYTNTSFIYNGAPSIVTGSAPFNGTYTGQGGDFSVFDYEYGDGTWTITIIDTACTGGVGPGGPWTPGWFDGASGGGFTFTTSSPPPPPCMGFIPNNSINVCGGQSTDILGFYQSFNPGYIYTITLNGGPVSNPSNVTSAGSYLVEAYDPMFGCFYWASYDVISSSVALGPDQVYNKCSNTPPVNLASLFPISGTASWTLNGTTITNAAAQSASTSGVYQVICQNAGGCGDTARVTLNVNPSPALGANQFLAVCAGAQVNLNPLYNTTGLTTSWSQSGIPVSNPSAVTLSGTYTLIATNANGCSDTALATIAYTANPALGPDQTITLCAYTPFNLTTLYNTAGFTTAWTLAGAPVSNPVAVTASGVYQLTATGSAGCVDTAHVNLNISFNPVLGPDQTATVCSNATTDLTTLFGTMGNTSTWTYGGALIIAPNAVSAPGTYTLIATNTAGCSDTANVNLTVLPTPTLGSDQSLSICSNTAADLNSLYNTTGLISSWTLSGNTISTPGSVNNAGIYQLISANAAGCSDTAQVTINLNQAPTLGADAIETICNGAVADLTSHFNVTGLNASWTFAGISVNNPSSVNTAGTYQLIATDAIGCSDTAHVVISFFTSPSLGTDQSFTLCPWQTVDLSLVFPVNGMTASYNFNGSTITGFNAVHDSGLYVIQITDINGCTDEAQAFIANADCKCEADLRVTAHCLQEPAQFEVIADSLLLGAYWNFGGAAGNQNIANPIVKFNTDSSVPVTLTATLSCGVVIVKKDVQLTDCADSCHLYLPASFTPNGDGLNDRFEWYSTCDPDVFSVEIYNRFGQLMNSTEDPHGFWDGKYKNDIAPAGLYVYRINHRFAYQKRKVVEGTIMLIR